MRTRAARCIRRAFALSLVAIAALTSRAGAQAWREQAAHLGQAATRVLVIGTRPEDEDNALIAWLSRGQHYETAFLSLTRGETGRNVTGAERNATLAVVRTAELLAERERDGAHQYFTRAFDLGATKQDSAVSRAWPRDSVLIDMVSIYRAFRPNVVIVLASDRDEDAGRRYTARLAAAAVAASADTSVISPRLTARLSVWQVARVFTAMDSASASADSIVRIDVGEFDRTSGRSFAELGAEIRRLQRTQGATAPPAPGSVVRLLHRDRSDVGGRTSLTGDLQAGVARHLGAIPVAFRPQFDTLIRVIDTLAARATALDADALAARLAQVVRLSIALRVELPCREQSGVPICEENTGDAATTLNSLRERATEALVGAAGIVIDGNATRELVAAGDTVSVALRIHNGGGTAITLRRLALAVQGRISTVLRDTSVVLSPAASATFTAPMRFVSPTYHWWQINGLVQGTLLQKLSASPNGGVPGQLFGGEDRIPVAQIEATVVVAGVEVPVIVRPLASRAVTALRGDVRHPVIGVPETSLLFERSAEYERANLPIQRLFRVFVQNARSTPDTVAVSLSLPIGVRPDSASKTVPLPPFSARNVFFRLEGAVPAGTHAIEATARSIAAPRTDSTTMPGTRTFNLGVVINEYPHIPAQHFVRFAKDRIESIALKTPPGFRVAYIRGTEDLRPAFQQLRLSVTSLDMALVPVANLTGVTSILIGAGALRGDAALLATPVLKAFMERGGVVVVLPGGRELSRGGLFPFNLGMTEAVAGDEVRGSAVQIVDQASPLARAPNVVSNADLEAWGGDRSCSVSNFMYSGWDVPMIVTDPGRSSVQPAVMTASVGKGRVVVTSLCLAQQLEGAQQGAAKLLVNMLSYGRPTR